MDTTKRDMLTLYAAGGAAALLVAGCTPTQVADTEKQITDLINKIQAGVVAACVQAGKIVPTANSVLQVLISIIGSTSVLGITAAMISQAIAEIVAVGCPATPTAMTPKGVRIFFY